MNLVKKGFVCNFFLVILKDSLPLRQNLGFYLNINKRCH
jgi:hypothetical protein